MSSKRLETTLSNYIAAWVLFFLWLAMAATHVVMAYIVSQFEPMGIALPHIWWAAGCCAMAYFNHCYLKWAEAKGKNVSSS